MSRKSYPNVNAANQYARDVVRGKIVACQFVIQACQRHLDDLMEEKSKSFRYRFDKDLAERAAKFIQLLPHTKGEWAFKRMPITLEPWQLFVICCAFGWVNKGTRLRRFREVYTEIPRKNGKSAISAGVALYCFACDNEFGAEVYSGATTEKQAWEVFRPARLMCKRTPMLTEAFGIEVNASNMNRPEDGARFEPLIGNPGDGSSPHCAVVDEYHEHATDALYTTMLTGMGARRQPLMWAITTAGYNIEGPCYDKRREVIEMLNGSVPNDELFGIIYTVDEGDDWTDPQVLEKANPNIGVSVYREFLLSQQQRAKNNARLANVFKTKHLNIWVSARSAYFNLVSWQSCEDKSLTLEQFEGQPCILAFDLARKLDMNSMARLYTREIDGKTHYYSVAPRFWVPYDTVYSVEKNEDRRTAERFQKWVEMGVLTVTDGAEVDYRYILEEAKAANKISPVSESPIDPFGATGLSHDLADEDLNPVTIVQNFANMDTKTAQKDKFGAGKNGFTRGNPQTGTPATDLDDDYFDMLQEELCSVVEASGASLEKGRHDQLLTALRALLLSRKNPFGDIKSDGTVKTALENLGLGEGAPAIGVPFFWPSAAMPDTVIDSWSSMVFLKFNGAKFSATDYPVLAKVFPALALPDARGDFIRIWDDGRGIDVGRTLLSGQSHTIMDHAHNMELWTGDGLAAGSAREGVNPGILATYGDGGIVKTDEPGLKVPSSLRALSSRSVKRYGEISGHVGTETRPRNIAFNFLVRAK